MRPGFFFIRSVINDYGLFKYPDYTLPLSVKMAEVSRDHQLDILHVHYAVPHATAAILARVDAAAGAATAASSPRCTARTPRCWARIPAYRPAIHHALDPLRCRHDRV